MKLKVYSLLGQIVLILTGFGNCIDILSSSGQEATLTVPPVGLKDAIFKSFIISAQFISTVSKARYATGLGT